MTKRSGINQINQKNPAWAPMQHRGLCVLRKRCTTLLLALTYISLFSQNTAEKRTLLNTHFDKAYELTFDNKDSAYYHYAQALQLAKELKDIPAQLDILGYTAYTSDYHYDLKKLHATLDLEEKLLQQENAMEIIEGYQAYQRSFLLDQGNYYFKTKEFDKAKVPFLKLFNALSKTPPEKLDQDAIETLYSSYIFLATIYKHTGKFDLSEEYYRNASSFVDNNKSKFDGYHDYITNVNRLWAQLYQQTGQYKKANALLSEARTTYVSYYAKDSKFKNNVLSIHQKLAENYLQQDSLASALYWLEEGKQFLTKDDPFYRDYLLLSGDVYTRFGKRRKALEAYDRALSAYSTYRNEKPHQDIASIYCKVAELHLKHRGYRSGLEKVALSLAHAGKNIPIPDITTQINPESVFSKRQLLHLLDIKLQLLRTAYEDSGNTTYLDAALATTTNMLAVFDGLRKEFESKLDKQFLAETCYPIFHHMIGVVHLAYERDKDPELIATALDIAEKNKDFILLETLRSTSASQFGNVPQAITDKEAQFRSQIIHLETRLFDHPEEKGASSELFLLKKEYYRFLDSLAVTFPKYHELKYGSDKLSLGEIRNSVLDNEGTLVSYTLTKEYLFVIALDAKTEKFLKLKFSEADRNRVREFYQAVSRPSIGATKKVIQLGEVLFKTVLRDPLKNLDNETLTIIPDGILHYIPFDILSENGRYLLRTKSISYANSISSLASLKSSVNHTNSEVLAFAPRFHGAKTFNATRKFGQLNYNDQELLKVNAFFKTASYLYDNATLKNFQDQAPGYGIIHLATHASANDEFPDYSYLAFSPSETENILYTKNLYGTTINATMVTLSACQTGIGKLRKGQGMLSLSKGFFYAGAKSLVNTLWKINDKSSVRLMEYFYESLSTGKTKNEALRQAKLNYLDRTEDPLLQHPYYWAAFIVSGDTAPIVSPAWQRYATFGFLGLLLLLMVSHRFGLFKRS